ncbi:MAG: glycosyltransferase [Coriobacteriia bacterium]|nr:glycosyltransferase [Coriobacteriia bacterium]
MQVTMVNKYYPPHLGGIEFHLRDLSTALAARGHHVRALVANEASDTVREQVDGVEVTRLGRTFAYSSTPVALGMYGAIRSQSFGESPADLLHLHFPYPWGEVSWLAAKPGLPTVLTYHSDIVRQKTMLAAYAPLLRRVLDRVDLIIASSPDMVEHSPFLSRVAEKCRVVPFGIDVDRFDLSGEAAARAVLIRAAHVRPVVLFVGRLVYYKGVDVLVEAMASVDADLVIVGSGPLEAQLKARILALGMQERTLMMPKLSAAELAAWFNAADVFCLPSVARSEAFGLVQLEAHASGTPVVSTRLTTGVPFVNQDGVTGLTVTPGSVEELAEALSRLVAEESLRKRLGTQARERVRAEFTIERMVEQTLAVYDEAMGVA